MSSFVWVFIYLSTNLFIFCTVNEYFSVSGCGSGGRAGLPAVGPLVVQSLAPPGFLSQNTEPQWSVSAVWRLENA